MLPKDTVMSPYCPYWDITVPDACCWYGWLDTNAFASCFLNNTFSALFEFSASFCRLSYTCWGPFSSSVLHVITVLIYLLYLHLTRTLQVFHSVKKGHPVICSCVSAKAHTHCSKSRSQPSPLHQGTRASLLGWTWKAETAWQPVLKSALSVWMNLELRSGSEVLWTRNTHS